MGQRDGARRIRRIVAAVALSDIAYRLFVRASVRRALGMHV
jgi:hypothetical protein